MSGPFDDVPYPALRAADFGPALRYRVDIFNGGRTVAIGDSLDIALGKTAALVQPAANVIDVVIHGLPGRFVEAFAGTHEIPAAVVAELLETQGAVWRGEPLRLLCCYAAEAPLVGSSAAQALATAWGGPVVAPDGLLRVRAGGMDVDLVD